MFNPDCITGSEDVQPFDGILEFPDVAGPSMTQEPVHGLGRDLLGFAARGGFFKEKIDQNIYFSVLKLRLLNKNIKHGIPA